MAHHAKWRTEGELREKLELFMRSLQDTKDRHNLRIEQLSVAFYDEQNLWATVTFSLDKPPYALIRQYNMDHEFLGLTPLVDTGNASIE